MSRKKKEEFEYYICNLLSFVSCNNNQKHCK